MPPEPPDVIGGFETWLLRRVAQAVEAGEVPASLLTELQAELGHMMESWSADFVTDKSCHE
jgi:hypothetical protein